ncbi:adenine deaminase C-terminal domain-containing protein [Gordonibacter sp.]|uniref:adenine deaminase C-terminal domain-containing protein n=1 Tax=Gordonibacter sp. TaxID=1968902 RepID=UPI002FC8E33F
MSDLESLEVTRVLIDGEVVAENGQVTFELEPFEFPEWVTHSMHLGMDIAPESFAVPVPDGTPNTAAHIRTIEVIPSKVGTKETHIDLPVIDGKLESDIGQDVLKTFVFERHHETGKFGYGFVKGFGIKRGAMASTVAHDAHNLLVVGTNDDDMALAANTLIACGGGMVVVDGEILGLVELSIAGLMDALPTEELSEKVHGMEKAWAEIGCTMPSPFMTMALIPLACLPELRLTNRGLVDCTTFQFATLLAAQ